MKKKRRNITDTEVPARTVAAMFVVGFGVIIAFGMPTLVTALFISRIYIGLAVVFSFIPKRFYPFIFRIRPKFRILLNIAGLAPVVTALVLSLNYLVPVETYEESYKIQHTVHYHYDDQFEVLLEGDALETHNQLRCFNKHDYQGIHDSAHFTMVKGLFGMPVMKGKRISMKYQD